MPIYSTIDAVRAIASQHKHGLTYAKRFGAVPFEPFNPTEMPKTSRLGLPRITVGSVAEAEQLGRMSSLMNFTPPGIRRIP